MSPRHGVARPACLGLILALGLASGCARGSDRPAAPPARAVALTVSARPAGCTDVPAGVDLQAAIDAAAPGASLCLGPGAHLGPITVSRGLTLWGPRGASVRTRGDGTTIRVRGAGVRLAGFTVDGSGGRYDMLDAAVHVEGEDHVVEGLRVVDAVYGLLAEKAKRVTLRANEVVGDAKVTFGLRGDSIRLWETTDSLVEGNRVTDGRDVVVWYSSRNRVAGNVVRGGRYGTHLMYSHENVVEDNVYERGVVGIFVMYSRKVTLRRNVVAGAKGSAGIGIGLKDAGDVRVEGNRLLRDSVGIYLDNAPSQLGDHDWIEGNEIRLCDAAVVFHSSGARNHLRDNWLADNGVQVRLEGSGDGRDAEWRGNYFDDYTGYDLDGDGVGDVAYELRSTSADLVAHRPQVAFLRGTAALALADAAGRLVPLSPPALVARDPAPRVAPPDLSAVARAEAAAATARPERRAEIKEAPRAPRAP